MKHLIIEVNSQTLKRLDLFKPAAGSVNYLTAHFSFSEDWSGTTKTAKCRKDNAIYEAVIDESGACLIPHEVLAQDETKRAFGKQEFYISVEGVDGAKIITTTETKIEVDLTGTGEEVNAAEPTPEIYAQYIEEVKKIATANPETITAAVNEYLDKHPIETPDTSDFVFNATIIDEESGACELDITAEEFLSAYNAGRTMVMNYEGLRLPLAQVDEDLYVFSLAVGLVRMSGEIYINDGGFFVTVNEIDGSITIGEEYWDGINPKDFTDTINNMIDDKLGVIENGAY